MTISTKTLIDQPENILPANTLPENKFSHKAKIILLGLLALAAWTANWFFLNQIVSQNQSINFLSWISLFTVLGIAFSTFFHLGSMPKTLWLGFNALLLAGYLLIMPKNFYVIIGGVIFTLMMIIFEYRIRSEEKSRQDFSIQKVTSASATLIIYGFLLLLGFNVYYQAQVKFNNNPDAYYQKLSEAVSKTIPYVSSQLQVSGLTDAEKQQLTQTLADQAVERVKNLMQGHEQYIPFVFALIVTGLLWTFAFILRWVAVVVTWILFEILLAMKFFRLTKVQVEVQKLEI